MGRLAHEHLLIVRLLRIDLDTRVADGTVWHDRARNREALRIFEE